MDTRVLTVGHACLDIVHRIPRIPEPNTKVDSREVSITIGGNAANCAAALRELGVQVDLCTVLGSEDHPFTRILISLLRSNGVGTGLCRFDNTQPAASSTVMVLDDGERAIVNWQGHELRNAVSLPESLKGYHMVQGDSYRLPMVRQVFAMAHAAGVPTMLDVDGPMDDIGTIPRADYIWFSHEAWRKHRISLPDLQQRFAAVIGITNGSSPVWYIGHDRIVRSYQPPCVVPLNTLGAGDVFRARLGLGICQGESLEHAVAEACSTACRHVTMQPLKDRSS